MSALRAEARRGRTIVLTTQILNEAEELCDDILIIDHGRQVARGDLQALKLLSEGVYEVSMTFEVLPQGLEAELAALTPLRLTLTTTSVQFAMKDTGQRVLALVSELASRGRVRQVEIGGASLEDVFLDLTGKAEEPS
jgi:ABC-2 type transport system ATP-binding protein